MLFSNYFVMYYIPYNYILIKSAGGRSAAALLRRDNIELSRLIACKMHSFSSISTKPHLEIQLLLATRRQAQHISMTHIILAMLPLAVG